MKQKTAIKMGLCGVLTAFALIISITAMTTASAAGEAAESGFVLRDYHGKLAVYDAGDLKTPMTVTSIETAGLPSADRDALTDGMTVASEEELILLLEDLNS